MSVVQKFLRLGTRYINMARVTHVEHSRDIYILKKPEQEYLAVYTGGNDCLLCKVYENTPEFTKLKIWLEKNSS